MQRRATIKDVAKRANVSIGTVSRVLNDISGVKAPKREAVLTAMRDLGYRPNSLAKGLKAGHSRTIGVLTQYVRSPHFGGIMAGILQKLNSSRYSVLFADGMFDPDIEDELVENLLNHRIDGLIVLEGRLSEDKLVELNEQVPLVVVGRNVSRIAHRCLWLDQFQAAYEATQYLIGLGHRNIAHIMGLSHHRAAQDRCDGYQQALIDAGIESDQRLILPGAFIQQSGVDAVETLRAQNLDFSAIFASNDQMAQGAMRALTHAGIRVPQDVSVIGFDDQPEAAYLIPALTTVRQPAPEMGELAAQAMLSVIAGESPGSIEFKGELIIRESTGLRQ